ncbi:homologous-pairing protein 2 homolog [Hydra vulgaris]|uniref:Homologous-pairing protein 2 homolog n=1 Tax=Hydra vulgaris TaxID=6087 RepID=A0ABM4B6W4_HYDVU
MDKKSPKSVILEYLQQQNRPYSAIDVFNNLHKELGKTVVVKTLETLAEEKKIIEKTYGKQKIYSPIQNENECHDENQLKSLDILIADLQEKVSILQQESKQLEGQLANFKNQLTTDEAKVKIQYLEKENTSLKEKIFTLKNNKNSVTKEDFKKIQSKKDLATTFWRKRKRMANDILDTILEGYPKSKKELLDETGLETDEDVGVVMNK